MLLNYKCRVWHLINKMDVDGADFFGTIERMRELFGKAIMPLQIPIGEGANFEGVIDVPK